MLRWLRNVELKGSFAGVANHLGIFDAYAFLRRSLKKTQTAILLYHRVCPKGEIQSFDVLSVESFERQMEYFSRNYRVLSLDEMVGYLKSGGRLPEKAVVITFDDGYKDNYIYAYPILQKYHFPATVFLVTGCIGTGELFWWDKVEYALHHTSIKQLDLGDAGKYSLETRFDKCQATSAIAEKLKEVSEDRKNFLIAKLLGICQIEIPPDWGRELVLSWKEVEEMEKGGVTFGAHTVSHPILTNLPLEQAKKEICQSKKDIEEKLGKKAIAFCYPNGRFNAQIVGLVRESGFSCALSISPSKLITPKDDFYRLSRIRAREDFNRFKVLLCGLYGDLQIPF